MNFMYIGEVNVILYPTYGKVRSRAWSRNTFDPNTRSVVPTLISCWLPSVYLYCNGRVLYAPGHFGVSRLNKECAFYLRTGWSTFKQLQRACVTTTLNQSTKVA